MKKLLLCFLLFAFPVQAASLYWDTPTTGTVTVEMGPCPSGPFTTVATIPASPRRYVLTPDRWGCYRLVYQGVFSNAVQYSLDLLSPDLTDRLDDLDMRVHTLETLAPTPTPAPASNLTMRMIDADHLEITGGNCVALKTTGTGRTRIVECIH